jgi:hypothetical protein
VDEDANSKVCSQSDSFWPPRTTARTFLSSTGIFRFEFTDTMSKVSFDVHPTAPTISIANKNEAGA